MSRVPPQSFHTVVIQQPPSNGLGVAGFVIALIGFLTCGLISPLGLLFSFCGLFKPPRGLAIAGFILGLLGSWWLVFFGFAIALGILGIGAATSEALREEAHRQDQVSVIRETENESVAESESGSPPNVAPDQPEPFDVPEVSDTATNEPGNDSVRDLEIETEMPDRDNSNSPLIDIPIIPETDDDGETPEPVVPDYPLRLWTDASGSHTVFGTFVSLANNKVTLRKQDGGEVSLLIERLSDSDQDYIRTVTAGHDP